MMYEPATLTLPVLDPLQLAVPGKRVGVLGGTFNPIHNGHIDIGLQMRNEFGLNKVLYMVAADPPHKDHNKDLAPAEDRLAMTELATLDHPGLWTSDLELRREGHTYTVDTMRILSAAEPETQFMFIIGEDTLYQLETWRDLTQLCKMTEFICVKRPGEEERDPKEQIRKLGERYDAVIHMARYDGSPDISSTKIRKRVREGKSIEGLVPKAVEEYIYAAGLYV